MALNGKRPVVAIYSTFLQRAYDQILIDVCMQNLPVTFAVDRAGVVGNDGETHNGLFDLSYFSHMPNMTVMVPKDGRELAEMIEYSLNIKGPCAIRYPRGTAVNLTEYNLNYVIDGSWEKIYSGKDAAIIACGKMVAAAMRVKEILAHKNYDVAVINAGFVKPVDGVMLDEIKSVCANIITIEDNVIIGGLGSMVNNYYSCSDVNVLNIGWPDNFVEHGDVEDVFKHFELDDESICKKVSDFIERKT